MCQNLSNLLVPCSWFLLKSASAFLSIHVPRYSTVPSTSHLTQKCLKLLTFQNLGSSVRLSLFHTVGKQLHAFLLMVIPLSWRLGNLALACFPHAAPAPLPSAASPGEHHSVIVRNPGESELISAPPAATSTSTSPATPRLCWVSAHFDQGLMHLHNWEVEETLLFGWILN